MRSEADQRRSTTEHRSGRSDVLVGTRWLADHLDDPRVRVIEVDVSPSAFVDGHIAGAVLWNIYTDLKDTDYHLVDRPAVERLVSRSGIAEDSTVVFYGYGPAIGVWLMELYRHHDVRILDASRDTWQAEHLPWTDRIDTPVPTAYRLPEADESIRASRQVMEAAIDDPDRMLLDVRTDAEFRGERFWPSGGLEEGGRAGHVPGAVHLVADDVRDATGAFRPDHELAALFRPLDLDAGHEILPYCTIGSRAATTWFVLTHLLGHDHVRVYDGSWAEWGRLPDVPVVTDAT